jgi:hypothetical protein
MKLVVDNSNVETLSIYNFKDLASCARKFADDLEAEKRGEPTRIVLVIDSPDGVAVDWWGETLNGYELLGLLEVAKQRTYEVNMTDGDD